jgi:branched-chain amino acid transport system substrate-binding protein
MAVPARAVSSPHRIGAVLELSEAASICGRPHRESIQMAIDARGGIRRSKVELVVYDNESSETTSVFAAKRLVEQDGVLAIVGAGTTPTTMPMIPSVTQLGVPLVSMGSADAIVTPGMTWDRALRQPEAQPRVAPRAGGAARRRRRGDPARPRRQR